MTTAIATIPNLPQIEGANLLNLMIVDDERAIREVCRDLAQTLGFHTSIADSAEHAYRVLESNAIDVVLLDLKLPGAGGLEALHQIRERRPDAVIIVVTGYGTVQSAVQAMKKRRIRLCDQTVQHGGTTTVAGPGVCAPEAQE